MGSEGGKPRKPRRKMPRVSKFRDSNSVPLAGLAGDSGGSSEPGVGQGPATTTRTIGPVGNFFLWCLGRRRKDRTETDRD